MKDFLALNDPSTMKFPSQAIDFPPNRGYIYNSLKMRAGFINRLRLCKDELKLLESQAKGKKARQGVTDDPNYSPLGIVMRVLHSHYRENDFMIKQGLTELVKDEEHLKDMINKN